jgi:hypothetical protein
LVFSMRQSARRSQGGGRRSLRLASSVALGAVLVLLLPGAMGFSIISPVGQNIGSLVASTEYPANISLGAYVGTHSAQPFYAVVFDDWGLGPTAAADLGHYFNSTPFTWYRLNDGGEGYNPTTQTNWVAPASGSGSYVSVSEDMMNLTWFKAWCDSRTPHCSWIASLPAEQNNTTAAVHVASYFHNVLHFVPTAWELGNEPNAWTHFGINSSRWSTTDDSVPTGLGYAVMVRNYIAAVSAVFPSDRFIGIESNCACGASLVSTTAELDGSKVIAMAYHSYPWANDSSNRTAQFMGALESPTRNLTGTAAKMRTLMAEDCASCANISIQVGEYNAGPVPVHSPLAMNYSGAPFIAASVIQAIQANVSMFTLYSLAWLYNSSSATLHPEGILYQEILNNLTLGREYSVNVVAPKVGGVFAMLFENGTHKSLLIVNTNNSRAITLPIASLLFPVGQTGSSWSWDPRSPLPIVQNGLTLPTSYTVWSQGILLLNN